MSCKNTHVYTTRASAFTMCCLLKCVLKQHADTTLYMLFLHTHKTTRECMCYLSSVLKQHEHANGMSHKTTKGCTCYLHSILRQHGTCSTAEQSVFCFNLTAKSTHRNNTCIGQHMCTPCWSLGHSIKMHLPRCGNSSLLHYNCASISVMKASLNPLCAQSSY